MTDSAIARMGRETGIDRDIIAALGEINGNGIDALCEAFLAARAKRESDLNAATDDGLRVIPRLIRPAVKKIVFG